MDTADMLNVFETLIWPTLIGVAIPIIRALLRPAVEAYADMLQQKTGVVLDAQARETIHSAIETALNSVQDTGISAKILNKRVASHVFGAGAGDSAARVGLTNQALNKLVASHLAARGKDVIFTGQQGE